MSYMPGLYIICGKPQTGKTTFLKKWAIDPVLSTERIGKYLKLYIGGKGVDIESFDLRYCLFSAITAHAPQRIIALDDGASLTGLLDSFQETMANDLGTLLDKNNTTIYIVLENIYEITASMYASAKGVCFTSNEAHLKSFIDQRGWGHLRKEALPEFDSQIDPQTRTLSDVIFQCYPSWPMTRMKT